MRDLGIRIGVHERTVAGYEADPPRSRPSYEKLVAISRVLDKPVAWFFEERSEVAA